ncbi:MAG: MoxR family ATPase [Planctomycetota bacterium]|nr:MoxR family ATPase [Planctomycetota bacterium]
MTSTTSTTSANDTAQRLFQAIRDSVADVVAVDDQVIETLIIAMFAGGHSLIEGIPGIGKTLLARTMARCVDCDFHRIQFTNDLMPSDIVGTSIWRQSHEEFTFSKGPLFSNIVLADEINRTSPRTLSCLLEAMENGTVSIDGQVTSLAEPFLVWATRNPIEFHGTYPIPEAAIDRFLVRVELGYPRHEHEIALYQGRNPEDQLAALKPVISRTQLIEMKQAAQDIRISAPVATYCYRVIEATRQHEALALGASPRAALSLIQAAKAKAFLAGRTSVLPDDLIEMAKPVLCHRLFFKGSGETSELVEQILANTPVEL